jgi:hypothetical protein
MTFTTPGRTFERYFAINCQCLPETSFPALYNNKTKFVHRGKRKKMGETMKFATVMKVMRMMKVRGAVSAALGAAILSGLAGCSDAPSESDTKQAVGKITGDCKYFTITHVLKVNFALPGSSDYQVDLQYSIEALPLPDAKNVTAPLMASLAALNARVATASAEQDRNFKASADFLDRIERAQKAGNETLARTTESQRSAFIRQKMEPGLKLARELAEEKTAMIKQGTAPLREEFFKACPKTSQEVYKKVYDNADIAPFVEGHIVDFATSLHMVKGERGWVAKD